MHMIIIKTSMIFQIYKIGNAIEANEMYDAIKEGGSTWILGHLMRVPAPHYFFALRIISTDNLFLHLLLTTRFSATLLYYTRFPKYVIPPISTLMHITPTHTDYVKDYFPQENSSKLEKFRI